MKKKNFTQHTLRYQRAYNSLVLFFLTQNTRNTSKQYMKNSITGFEAATVINGTRYPYVDNNALACYFSIYQNGVFLIANLK
jgi:hypothetical protein